MRSPRRSACPPKSPSPPPRLASRSAQAKLSRQPPASPLRTISPSSSLTPKKPRKLAPTPEPLATHPHHPLAPRTRTMQGTLVALFPAGARCGLHQQKRSRWTDQAAQHGQPANTPGQIRLKNPIPSSPAFTPLDEWPALRLLCIICLTSGIQAWNGEVRLPDRTTLRHRSPQGQEHM